VWACSWTYCRPCSLCVGFYSGQIILETRCDKCKSSPKIPEIQWIALQPNCYFRATNIPTSFDSQFWTSIDSLSVPFASHCATRRRYSLVQISFLPCPVGRLKWPQSNHHPLNKAWYKPSGDMGFDSQPSPKSLHENTSEAKSFQKSTKFVPWYVEKQSKNQGFCLVTGPLTKKKTDLKAKSRLQWPSRCRLHLHTKSVNQKLVWGACKQLSLGFGMNFCQPGVEFYVILKTSTFGSLGFKPHLSLVQTSYPSKFGEAYTISIPQIDWFLSTCDTLISGTHIQLVRTASWWHLHKKLRLPRWATKNERLSLAKHRIFNCCSLPGTTISP